MKDNSVLRRFLRRESDEWVVHQREFSSLLKLTAFHVFARLTQDPEVEVVEPGARARKTPRFRIPTAPHLRLGLNREILNVARATSADSLNRPSQICGTVAREFRADILARALSNLSDSYGEPERISVSWESCAVGPGETAQFVAAGWLLGIHHGLGGLRFVAALLPYNDGVELRLVLRADDFERMQELLAWMERLESDEHPLRGRLFSLAGSRLEFLGAQGVSRDDLVLPDEVLDEVERHLLFLDDPEAFPSSLRHAALLLAGPPGVGKTMLTKWLSSRFRCTGLWVTPGTVWELGASAVFRLARQLAPTLLILEDLDVASGDRSGHQPLGELLGQLDGFVKLQDVAVVATTNHPEALDSALDPMTRPGRFDRLITVEAPGAAGRERLLRQQLAASELVDEVAAEAFDALVKHTRGATGARIAEVVRDLERRMLWRGRQGLDTTVEAAIAELCAVTPIRAAGELGFAERESA